MSESAQPDLSVVVFAYNEAQNIAPVLAELRAWLDAHASSSEIVFVDDGSSDGSAEVARGALASARHRVLVHPVNQGIGAALKTGIDASVGRFVTFLPADGQIAPDAIGTLRAAAEERGAELVLSLYRDRDDGLSRKALSWGMRALVRTIHGVRLESDGPYLFRRELFSAERPSSDSFFLNLEFPIRLLAAGVPSATVTISCRPRRAGHSKSARIRVIGRVARELVLFRIRRALEHNKRSGGRVT